MVYALLRPVLFRLDPERAHGLANRMLRVASTSVVGRRLLHALYSFDDPILRTHLAGLAFRNPIGLAAGYDKGAALVQGLSGLGFGSIEVGTITPQPQVGNPPPRLFRLAEEQALINRLGFNNPGMLVAARQLRQVQPYQLPVGVNIGKNRATPLERAAADYLAAFYALAPLADYVTINISSPNTPGLRALQRQEPLRDLLEQMQVANRQLRRPLLVKVSPDESAADLDALLGVALECGVAGLIASNTTTQRAGLRGRLRDEAGGLSGPPLRTRALATLRYLAAGANGQLALVAAGGIASAADAYVAIRAGATSIQLYTALVYGGPGLPRQIKRDLAALLRREGFTSVAEAVGRA